MSRKDRDNKNITLKLSIFSVYGHGHGAWSSVSEMYVRWLYIFGLLDYILHWFCKVVNFALSADLNPPPADKGVLSSTIIIHVGQV